MRFVTVGSGAVGGYFGAKLARAGHDVTFIARGAHLEALRERGMTIRSPMGDFTVQCPAEADTTHVGTADVAILAVKAYSNAEAIPMLRPVVERGAVVLPLQNGVDSIDEVAAAVGESSTLGGSTYVATAIAGPGVIDQTGDHRRVVFGEVFGNLSRVSDRVSRIRDVLAESDIVADAVPDARTAMWEKFVYLAPFAAFTGAARLPIGPLWADPTIRERLLEACAEVEHVGRAHGIAMRNDMRRFLIEYMSSIPGSTRSSLLIDLEQGKPIEVEALLGSAVRRGREVGVPTPIMETLYTVLKPHTTPR
jgi:2-dehydropantoate 2-reductase